MRGQLHALRLASRERRRRLPKSQVSKAHFVQYAKFLREPRNLGKKLERFANGKVQHLVNALAFVVDFEHLRLVARPLAFVADQFHIGQELHFDRDRAVALAGIATPARYVERKVSGREAALLRFRQRSKQFADDVKRLDVRDWIRARSAA